MTFALQEIETSAPADDRASTSFQSVDVLSDRLNETTFYSAFESPQCSDEVTSSSQQLTRKASLTASVVSNDGTQETSADARSEQFGGRGVLDSGVDLNENALLGSTELTDAKSTELTADVKSTVLDEHLNEDSLISSVGADSPPADRSAEHTPKPAESVGTLAQPSSASHATSTASCSAETGTHTNFVQTHSMGTDPVAFDAPPAQNGNPARTGLLDTLNSLENWLDEAEDLMNSQRKPSADPKVLSAQLQSHELHIKLVDDKHER